jgi:hypothetical protein
MQFVPIRIVRRCCGWQYYLFSSHANGDWPTCRHFFRCPQWSPRLAHERS